MQFRVGYWSIVFVLFFTPFKRFLCFTYFVFGFPAVKPWRVNIEVFVARLSFLRHLLKVSCAPLLFPHWQPTHWQGLPSLHSNGARRQGETLGKKRHQLVERDEPQRDWKAGRTETDPSKLAGRGNREQGWLADVRWHSKHENLPAPPCWRFIIGKKSRSDEHK